MTQPSAETGKRRQSQIRLARIAGQIRGLQRMLDGKEDCLQIINQISAVREALAQLGVALLRSDLACKWQRKQKIDEVFLKNLFRFRS